MKKRILFAITIFALLWLMTGCDMGGPKETGYAIGDIGPSGVGIVFYITDGGRHGLEVAPSDQSTSQAWSNIDSIAIGSTGTAIGTGATNTDAIIAQTGHTGSAAQVCRDYNGGGYDDWFLPSKDELNLLYLQKDTVGSFTSTAYWSSSEDGSGSAWLQEFFNGFQYDDDKDDGKQVRAVRAF